MHTISIWIFNYFHLTDEEEMDKHAAPRFLRIREKGFFHISFSRISFFFLCKKTKHVQNQDLK